MNFSQRLWWYSSTFLFWGMFLPIAVTAQPITADGTLSTTVTSPDNLNFTITNGNQPNSGGNLFHSFSQFSVPTGGSATFNLVNTPNITTIFSRVTGGSVSNIDGLIQTTNNSNPVSLFLLNPNGIIFGPNASLTIGGSFVGTTANSVKFVDGIEFSAVNPSASPLLTVNAPIGLNFGQNSKGITVQNTGHRLIENLFQPVNRSQNPIGLQVAAGNTLALIGSGVNFSGGIASVNGGGHIEVGSVSNGLVKLNPKVTGWVGDYASVQQFNDIHLAQQSLLDASGNNGSIQVQGRNISFTEGSTALLQNFGMQNAGGITVRATETLNLSQNTADGKYSSMIRIDNLGNSQTGTLMIAAAQLLLSNGGTINSQTFGLVPSGNIVVNVAGSILIDSFITANPALPSSIVTSTVNSAQAGDITVSTGNLEILDGGAITSFTFASGQSGRVQINAQDLIEIAGINPIVLGSTSLSTLTLGSGNANSIFVNTSRLVIRDGALVGSNASSLGSSGNVIINASQSVVVEGEPLASVNPSRIASTAKISDLATQAAFGLPPIPSGDAGFLRINTPSLRITDGASVTVINDGSGKAGDLQINANSIFLDNQGSILASTASGNGGEVNLNLQSSLLLRHNSLISATAAGNGNGGNLIINSPVIVGIENSDIIANAIRGAGGNINITTQGLFGLKFRPQLTPENDITASSQFGLSGTVNISNLAFTPTAGLIQLPSNIDDPSQRIAQGCRTYGNSRFVATGRGGLPENPSDRRSGNHPWTDIRDPSAFRSSNALATVNKSERQSKKQSEKQSENATPPIVEATGWQINTKGEVDLYTINSAIRETTVTDCAGFLAIAPNIFKVKEVVSNEF
ncbi:MULTISPECIES: filamentous hemagglutinin N-terminal domain-containing protein [Pseudanabaena]|uniref:Filamentous hemagglutinin family outer membrane protein n=2 Tax=Pseudanabaena TaxID=1152 RepID=L8MRT7_9CYAN|nr:MULTISPECIES: filamentous hemagglutinin N-terminal domain-containing protein [Pseudanabaena]ELS30627.1 filamentous hemagglutinin family outer membrane protein [Pseudanabaena biceps PCC 7429]MDG3497105.1 filamentous hemagglutinin N-terminal domain-containing protein [Pseudanabaena catenata USMAC16]